jgi:hypothetical protein
MTSKKAIILAEFDELIDLLLEADLIAFAANLETMKDKISKKVE